MNDEIKIEDIKISLLAVWRKKWFIVAVMILTALIGLLYTSKKPVVNTYVASSSVYSAANGSYDESTTGTTALISYTDIATTKKVCESASSLLGLDYTIDADTIQSMVSVSQSSENIINISAYSRDSEVAVEVANAMADAFVRELTAITGLDSIQILDTASTAYVQSDGQKEKKKDRMMFAMFGAFISGAYVFLTELFSNRVRTIVQCIDDSEDEILGIVPFIEK